MASRAFASPRFERAFIENMIRKCEGNRELAAQHMGINPSTLYRKLSEADATTKVVT
ncbi:helix-turn-helix domain-containing protein [Thalassobacterium sedimentorum]|uniref:helix-turn-helix domain-containing protein n=1 Tax=Thalassobacterium sedimentorum TaxID=3041258 RepID=UPI003CE553E8